MVRFVKVWLRSAGCRSLIGSAALTAASVLFASGQALAANLPKSSQSDFEQSGHALRDTSTTTEQDRIVMTLGPTNTGADFFTSLTLPSNIGVGAHAIARGDGTFRPRPSFRPEGCVCW
jgi:hypothetical protein